MAYNGLREFLHVLEKNGQLLRISEPVLPERDRTFLEVCSRKLAVEAKSRLELGPAEIWKLEKQRSKLFVEQIKFVVEIRNKSWFDQKFADLLREYGVALALTDTSLLPRPWEIKDHRSERTTWNIG